MPFEEGGGLVEQVVIKLNPKFKYLSLAYFRHQVRGKEFGDPLKQRKGDKHDRYRRPCFNPIVGGN